METKLRPVQYVFSALLSLLIAAGIALGAYWILGFEWVRGALTLLGFMFMWAFLFSAFEDAFMFSNMSEPGNEREKNDGHLPGEQVH